MYGDLPLADHLETVAGDDDRGAFGEADAEQVGILLDHGNDVVPAIAGIDVLVDGDLAEEGEAVFVLGFRRHDDFGAGDGAAHQVVALNGGAGRTAADDAAALEDLVEFAEGERVGVGVHDIPLASAVEPDGVGVAQDLGELLGVGDFRIVRVQHEDVGEAALFPGGEDLLLVVDADAAVRVSVAAGGGDDDDLRVESAGLVDECFDDPGAVGGAAALDHQGSFGGSVFGRLREEAS